MKKSFILTSVLALAACAGGNSDTGIGTGFEKPGAAANSEYYPSGTTTDNIFGNGDAGIKTQIVSNKEEVIAYVESRIGAPAAKSNAARSAVKLGDVDGWSIDERYERAVAALAQMEKVMKEMIAMSGDAGKLNDYIAKNSDQVKDALKLLTDDASIASAGKDIDAASSDKLAEMFRDHDFKSADDLHRAKEHVVPQAKIQKIDDIDFRIADAFESTRQMKVKTENGKVVGISDTGWDKPGQDEMFVTGRIGNNTDFSRVSYEYDLLLGGEHDDSVDVYSVNGNLTGDALKQAALERLEQQYKKDKKECEESNGMHCNQTYEEEYQDRVKRVNEGKYTVRRTTFDTTQNVESMGHLAGLTYSDFGVLKKVIKVYDQDGKYEADMFINSPYAGGYESKAVDKAAMSDEMVFDGTAVIAVERNEWPNDEEETVASLLSTSKSAKLHFKDGKETLTMVFPDYYTIKITNDHITFSEAEKVTNKDLLFKSVENGSVDLKGNGFDGGYAQGTFETGYYGDNGRASEATAIFGYGEERGEWGDKDQYELEMTGAFGGKR